MDEDGKAARIAELAQTDVMREQLDRLRQQLVSMEGEYALVEKELAFMRGSPGVGPSAKRRVAMDGPITCKHSCEHHVALMDPAVWRNLPGEVLLMAFARLPLHQILSLQCLSKEWRRNVTRKESGFRRLCASVTSPDPKLFAIVSEGRYDDGLSKQGFVLIKMFDVKSQKWQYFEMLLPSQYYYNKMFASDGGLACFVASTTKKVTNPLIIVVVNPLTKEWKLLPALSNLDRGQPAMLHLVMDRVTKCYKVIVVWKKQRIGANILGMVYDSTTENWSSTNAMSDLVFGYHFRWTNDPEEGPKAEQVGPCVYDCQQTQLLELGDHANPPLASCKGYALVKDHLFVLHERTSHNVLRPGHGGAQKISQFIISEYQGQKSSPHWVYLRIHDCEPAFRDFPGEFDLILHACRGSLMVTAKNDVVFGPFKVVRTWLYDLSTCDWQALPVLPEDENEDLETRPSDEMCELQWDAVP